MAKLIYSTIASADGYVEDAAGKIDWAAPDEESAAERDITVGGVDLAGQAIKAGLVDELGLFLVPVIIGGGKRALPHDARADLELLDTQRFAGGTVYLRYRPNTEGLFSDYSPAGHGLTGIRCHRGAKDQYLAVRSKADYWPVPVTEEVPETYLCAEYERRIPGTGYRGWPPWRG